MIRFVFSKDFSDCYIEIDGVGHREWIQGKYMVIAVIPQRDNSILDNLSFCGRSGNEKSKQILKIGGKIKKALLYIRYGGRKSVVSRLLPTFSSYRTRHMMITFTETQGEKTTWWEKVHSFNFYILLKWL